MVTVAAVARSCCTAVLFESLYGLAPQNQMVLVVRSIGRLHWNWNDAHQPRGPANANGTLTSTNTAAVPAANAAAVSQRASTGRGLPKDGFHPPEPSQSAIGSANIAG